MFICYFFNKNIVFFFVKDNNDHEIMHNEEEVADMCPSPSEGLVAVEALMAIISFTPPRVSVH